MPRDAVPNSFRLLLEMDLTGDIVSPAFTTPRVVLAKDTGRNRAGAFERVIQRQSLLTPVGAFGRLYESLGFVGNTLSRLGQPGGVESFDGASTAYSYAPFHAFEFPFTDVVAEPLAFFRDTTSGLKPVINPDVALFLGLEERTIGSGIWSSTRAPVARFLSSPPKGRRGAWRFGRNISGGTCALVKCVF